MRVLITGITGLLGSRLAAVFNEKHDVYGVYTGTSVQLPRCDVQEADITDRAAIGELISSVKPGLVVHTAALTDVDLCETDKQLAKKINVDGTRNVFEASKQAGAKFVFVSTDFVFDGKTGRYTELDAPNPISYYGQTKLEAENIVLAGPDSLVTRTSTLYGRPMEGQRSNFVTWVVEKFKRGERIKLVTDQVTSPTHAGNLAQAIFLLSTSGCSGVYNAVGDGCVSRFDFAREIARVFNLEFNAIPVLTKELNQPAPRPKFSCLDISKVKNELSKHDFVFFSPSEGLNAMKNEF